jgi:AraC family transcriptional activator of pobA
MEMEIETLTISEYFKDNKPCLSFHTDTLENSDKGIEEVHRHDYYKIYLFDNNEYNHNIDFKRYNCVKNSISVLFPHQFHKLENPYNASGTVLMFTEEMFCSEMLRKELRAYCLDMKERLNCITLTEEAYNEIKTLSNMITDLYTDLNIIKKEQIRHLIKLIILKLLDYTKTRELSQKETSETNLFMEFTNMVDEKYREVRLVSEYCELLDVTPKRLNALSKKYNGQTAIQVIHEKIYIEARRLLAFSEHTHKEIAYNLNFDSPSAFSKFIQKKSGYTPTQLQKKLTQIYIRED